MRTIYLDNPKQVKLIQYPDSQPNVQIVGGVVENEGVEVVARIRSSTELMQLLMLANALDHQFIRKQKLTIPYLMGARSDRVMNLGEACPLEVVADLINGMNFEQVELYDIHSDVAPALIKRSINRNNYLLVTQYTGEDAENAVLIVPDAGGAKKASRYLQWNSSIKEIVYCTKERNTVTGEITLKVLNPEKCLNRNCVIIDDLCDGGATFNAIAKQIGAPGLTKTLTLIVTHGVFSKGFDELKKNFTKIITSSSYRYTYDCNIVTVIGIPYS